MIENVVLWFRALANIHSYISKEDVNMADQGNQPLGRGATISVVFFVVVALTHLLRLMFGWEVSVAGTEIPMWVSVVGVIIPGVLAFLLVADQRK